MTASLALTLEALMPSFNPMSTMLVDRLLIRALEPAMRTIAFVGDSILGLSI